MRTSGLPFKFLEFSFGPTKVTANCKIGQCFPLHQTRRSFHATPGIFCWSMWMTNDFEIEFLIFLLQSLSMKTISEQFDSHLGVSTYTVPISSRALHALYTIPRRSRLTKTNAQPTQTMSVTIHEKGLFPSLIFWHLCASAFFLFSVFIVF